MNWKTISNSTPSTQHTSQRSAAHTHIHTDMREHGIGHFRLHVVRLCFGVRYRAEQQQFTYSTHVRCHHVLFIALDREIIRVEFFTTTMIFVDGMRGAYIVFVLMFKPSHIITWRLLLIEAIFGMIRMRSHCLRKFARFLLQQIGSNTKWHFDDLYEF